MAMYGTATEIKPEKPDLSGNYEAGQVPKKGDNPAQIIGVAIINNTKMVGSLTGAETRLMLSMWPNAKADNWLQSIPDPVEKDQHIGVRIITKDKPKIKIHTKGKLKIDVEVSKNIEITSISSYTNYVTDPKKQKLLVESIEKDLEEDSNNLIKRAQKEFKVDIFNWYYVSRKNFWTIKQLEDYKWDEKFPDAEVKVKYHVTIKQFGKEMDPIDKKKIEGK